MKLLKRSSGLAVVMAVALSAVAAPTGALARDNDEIVIYPNVVRHEHVRRPGSAAPMEQVSLSAIVTTHDLDLRYDQDVAELERRIGSTAYEICEVLGEEMPNSQTTDRECVRNAIDSAVPQARRAVARARG